MTAKEELLDDRLEGGAEGPTEGGVDDEIGQAGVDEVQSHAGVERPNVRVLRHPNETYV